MLIAMGSSGRSVYMSTEQYCIMSDEDFTMMTAYEQGSVFNHPFTDSVLTELIQEDEDEEEWVNEDQSDRDLFSLKELEDIIGNDSFAEDRD